MPRLVTSASKFTAMKVSALRPDTVSNDTAEGEVMKARVTIEYELDRPEGETDLRCETTADAPNKSDGTETNG
jgi:hypothetical protein